MRAAADGSAAIAMERPSSRFDAPLLRERKRSLSCDGVCWRHARA